MSLFFRSLFSRKKKPSVEKNDTLRTLETILGFEISRPDIFERALRHRSTLASDQYAAFDSYERLEFLGDAVLDLIAAEILYEKFPRKDEGFLTKMRAKLVKGETLAQFSEDLGLASLMEIGERSKQMKLSVSMLADVFESVIAAIYITAGYAEAYRFVKKVYQDHVDFDALLNTTDNFKSALLEYTQAEKMPLPHYELISESGPGHNKTFEVKVVVGEQILGTGSGKSKKKAEQVAAEAALQTLLL